MCAGQDAGHYADEIVPLIDRDGQVHAADDGVRRDSSMANLAMLKPFFDRKYGASPRATARRSPTAPPTAGVGLAGGGRAPRPAAARAHHRQPVGGSRARPDGPRSGARHDADPSATVRPDDP